MAQGAEAWRAACARFSWALPDRYNIGWEICGRWAEAAPDRLALIDLDEEGGVRRWSYGALAARSARLSNLLRARGVGRGDRVAVLLPQSADALVTHVSAYRLGAILVPLFPLFGEEGLAHRLSDSGATALITDRDNLAKILAIRARAPELAHVFCVDGPEEGAEALSPLLDEARDQAPWAATGSDDPAFISYTSGTTGPAKGALHGHRVLAAHVEGARILYDLPGAAGEAFWTPAGWAWLGGSMNAMAPALAHGAPLVAHRMNRFDPERAFDLMARHEVRRAFLPPTALKLMREVPDPARFGHKVKAVGAAGEAMGAAILDWGREAFGLTIHEFYGQTECNMLIGNNAALMTPKPGAMGLPMPGHEPGVLGPDGRVLQPGQVGELAFRTTDEAGLFLGYWNLPDKTAEKVRDGWLMTGDEALVDEDGYYHFSARTDDVITSSGYRIGPAEIEDCLARHPGVAVAAVVGAPDPIRTERIVAFVKPAGGAEANDALAAALIGHVRLRLSPHMAPAEIRYVEEIPMTATGKILRRELRER